MKNKTEITPDRLRSLGYNKGSGDYFNYKPIDSNIQISYNTFYKNIELYDEGRDSEVFLDVKKEYIEDLKTLMEGVYNKKDFRR